MDDLSQSERELCQNVVVFGIDYLRTVSGWDSLKIEAFIKREEVRREVEHLKRQYEDRTGIQERTQFFATLKLNGMVPAAINVLARSLRGAYTDPSTGTVTAPPARGQLDAALEILTRSNIQGTKWAGNDQTPSIDARSVNIAIGKGGGSVATGISAEGRERVLKLLSSVVKGAQAKQPSKTRRTRDTTAEVEQVAEPD